MEATLLQKLIYPELSYRIVGILYRVHNELKHGYQEKHVQRAVAAALLKEGIVFQEQVSESLLFDGEIVGRYYLDFVISEKVVLELKVGEKVPRESFNQVKQYLERSGLLLGLLAYFGRHGVKVYRILQPQRKDL